MLMKIKIKAKRYIVPAQKKIARCGKIDRKKREFGGSLVKFRAVGTEEGQGAMATPSRGMPPHCVGSKRVRVASRSLLRRTRRWCFAMTLFNKKRGNSQRCFR